MAKPHARCREFEGCHRAPPAGVGDGYLGVPCNWLQHYENLVDPFYAVILHISFSGTQSQAA
jgi:hypothetical protein